MNDDQYDDDDSDPVENDDLQDESPDSTPTPTANPEISEKPINPVLKAILAQKSQLQQAQEQAQNNRIGAGIAAALGQIGHGLSRSNAPVDLTGAKLLEETANQPVQDVMAQQASESKSAQAQQEIDATDPDSDQSKSFRNSLKVVAPKIANAYGDNFDHITAADAPNIMRTIDLSAQLDQRAQAAKDRADVSKMNAEAKSSSAQEKLMQQRSAVQDKQNKQDEDTQAKISKDLNSLTASSRSALGTAAKAKISAARLSDIVADPNATNQDLQSAYADLNNIVAGSTTQGGTEHQSYNTLNNQLAQAMQYITSNPQAPNIPEVKKHVADVAARMTKISDDVVNRNTAQVQSGRSAWIKRHPDDWQNMVTAATGSDGADQSAAKRTVTNDQLQKYATTHNITPDAAGAWLKSQGYQLGQ